MAEFDPRNNRLTVKLVYYGPALSGKTTNLIAIYDALSPVDRSDLKMVDTQGDRTIFFEALPAGICDRIRLKLKIFTVPGLVADDGIRRAVLSHADGVVFVADSQRNEALRNYESFKNLEKNAALVGLDIESLPVVIQFNKRDLAESVPEKEIEGRWRSCRLPVYFASARYGWGVEETFSGLLKGSLDFLDKRLSLKENYGYQEEEVFGRIVRSMVRPSGPEESRHNV
ncbi:MAG: GTPase domain-containing protein [Pseudomonadota bacterium]